MSYRDFVRWQMMREAYEKMTPEEKIAFSQNDKHREVMSALSNQQNQLEEIRKRQSWLNDFTANLSANALWDGVLWVGGKLLKLK